MSFEKKVRTNTDPDGILFALTRDSAVLAQKDPLMWNWAALSNVFLVRHVRDACVCLKLLMCFFSGRKFIHMQLTILAFAR